MRRTNVSLIDERSQTVELQSGRGALRGGHSVPAQVALLLLRGRATDRIQTASERLEQRRLRTETGSSRAQHIEQM